MTCFSVKTLAGGLLVMALSCAANAQATRTWVSGVGDDVNPCSRTAPCKTFAGAIAKTAANGIIDVLDPGGFGPVTITKSITIDGGGNISGVLAPGTNGININGSGIVVTLRNLDIEGGGSGLIGINIIAAQAVNVEGCLIYGFGAGGGGSNGRGINDQRSTAGTLAVSDTIIKNNAQSAILIGPSASVTANLTRVRLLETGNSGLVILSNAVATISNSDIAGNTSYGLFADGTGILNSENVRITDNGAAGAITTGGTIRLSNTTITNNGSGFSVSGGTINTFSNNKIAGNTNPNVGALTPISQQ